MENKISVIDIAEDRASINDIKFGWKMNGRWPTGCA